MDSSDKLCLVCHEAIEIFAIGKCDHAICYKCSTRMRGLCEQFYCPICRTDLPEVFFLTTREKYTEMPVRKFIKNRRLKIQFENDSVRETFEALLEHKCKSCPDRPPERSFKALQDHMRRIHTMFFCDLCLALKIFSSERKIYNRHDLAVHRRTGDVDDTSYKGHPLCQFCDERYLDKDELYKHLRKDHYFCHFCESLGSQDFFQDYGNLRDHFMTDHYLCEEGECIDKQFENAFKSEIDLKAHRANFHSRAQSKYQSRQERTLNIDINLVPRPSNRGRGAVNREDYEETRGEGGRRYNQGGRKNYPSKREKEDVDRAIQASLSTMTDEVMKNDKKETRKQENKKQDSRKSDNRKPDTANSKVHANSRVPDTVEKKPEFVHDIESFPSLGDMSGPATTTASSSTSETPGSLANKFAMSHNMSVHHGLLGSQEDFPTLTRTASGNDLGNLVPPSFNYQSLKSSQSPKVAKPAKKPQTDKPQTVKQTPPTKKFKNSALKEDLIDDFPELPKAAKTALSASSNNWKAAQTATAPVVTASNMSVIKEKPSQPPAINRDKPNRLKYDDADFPTLGGSSAANEPTGPSKWFKSSQNNTKSKNRTVLEESTAYDNRSDSRSIIDRFSPVNVPDNTDDKKSKNKKKKKKESVNPKEQIKKENAKNSLKENASLDNIASLLISSNTGASANDIQNAVVDNEPVKAPVKTYNQQTKLSGNFSKPKEDKIEKKMENLLLDTKKVKVEQVEKADPVKFVIEDEFPSLGAPAKAAKKPPPPGFKKETEKPAFKAPPGFGRQNSNSGSKAPPPGFISQGTSQDTKPSVNNNGILPMSNSHVNFEYVQPDGFSERNKDLIGIIQACCLGSIEFAEFKKLSGEFRRSDISAQHYYEQCEEVLGKNNFSQVFPELLALLPDISKQQELLSVYIVKYGAKRDDEEVLSISGKSRSGKGAWTPSLSGFLTCQTCKQVLVRKDYNAHVSLHNLDSDFPSLSDEMPVAKGGLSAIGSWVKAK